MSIKIKLRNHLLDDKEISDTLTDIYSVFLPQDPTYPAATYQKISSNPTHTHQGNTQLVTERFQLSFFHEKDKYGELEGLLDKVKDRMDEFESEESIVQSCFLDDENEQYEDDSTVFMTTLDYMISYRRSDL